MISFNRKKLLSTICFKDFARFLQVRLRNLNLDPTDRLRKDPVEPHKMFVQNNSLNTLCLESPARQMCLERLPEAGDHSHSS